MWNLSTKKTILITDDDEVMVLLLKKIFEKKYNVFTACDGVEAIDHLSGGICPDLIITDILMENIDGYQLVKHLSTSIIYRHIPIIILSGSKDIKLSYQVPGATVLCKPFDPLQLKELVETTILKKYDRNIIQ
ncbi:response regulator [Parafilimonas sp.]|uniref:response regulator n=1 Tax=Parafilimonas sp. TaxID=1969739 RepID=UPI0039E57118